MIKSTFHGAVIFTLFLMFAGCAGNKELIKEMSSSTTQNVFQEMGKDAIPANGYADLRISSSLKTNNPNIYFAWDVHGTPDFELLLNIDGQAVLLRGYLQKENSESRGQVDPEAGSGIRYEFNKNLRLETGTHKIFVAIPSDGIAVKREISLVEGNVNNLVLEPIYNYDTKPRRDPIEWRPWNSISTSFKKGIGGIRLIFNGRVIASTF